MEKQTTWREPAERDVPDPFPMPPARSEPLLATWPEMVALRLYRPFPVSHSVLRLPEDPRLRLVGTAAQDHRARGHPRSLGAIAPAPPQKNRLILHILRQIQERPVPSFLPVNTPAAPKATAG